MRAEEPESSGAEDAEPETDASQADNLLIPLEIPAPGIGNERKVLLFRSFYTHPYNIASP